MNRGHELLPGIKLNKGKYVVKSLIRSGTMSNVYLIEDVPALNRKMIVKEIFYESWEYEKETVLKIGRYYPEINWYIDDFMENGIPYFVMQYVEGKTLEDYFGNDEKNERKRFEQIVDISIFLVGFVCKLHRCHIIHGDISPDNIIITENREVYLIDYGNSLVTEGVCCSYKEGYSAPELKGNTDRGIDCRCDIYSIGATMRYMVKKPVESSMAGKIYEKDYHRIFRKCLKSKPEERYHSVRCLYYRLILCKYRLYISIVLMVLLAFFSVMTAFRGTEDDYSPTDSNAVKSENRLYYVINDSEVTITGSNASDTEITIPSEIEGYKVKSIKGIDKNVTKVTISEGIERIEEYAFENCQYLKEISIPASVSYIDEYAFINCGQLQKVNISPQNQYYIIDDKQLVDKRDGNIMMEIEP